MIDGYFDIVYGFMFESFGSCAKLIRGGWGRGVGHKHGMAVQSVADGKYVIL